MMAASALGQRPLAVFRVDAGPAIGGGHVMRCLTLAEALSKAGWRCLFATTSETEDTVPGLARSGFARLPMPADPTEQPAALQRELPDGPDLLVVDHYGLDVAFESACRAWATRILVIDDLADRPHDCDILIDQTYGRAAEDYTSLVPERCEVLAGAQYALLRPAFAAARPEALARREAQQGRIDRILVSMGTVDPRNATGLVLEGVREAGLDATVDVVLGSGAPHMEAVREQTEAMTSARLLTDVADIATLMSNADLAIGAGGTTSWERCCLGLPTLAVTIADNQVTVLEELARSGAVRPLGDLCDLSASAVAATLHELTSGPAKVKAMSTAAQAVCDGRGPVRLLVTLAGEITTHEGARIRLRTMESRDEATVLEWQCRPGMRRHFRNPEPPDPATHQMWMRDRLKDPDCLPTIVQCDGRSCGLLRLDKRGNRAEISILVAPEFWGRGISVAALSLARGALPGYTLVAQIDPRNAASLKAFARAGFRPDHREGWHYAPPVAEYV